MLLPDPTFPKHAVSHDQQSNLVHTSCAMMAATPAPLNQKQFPPSSAQCLAWLGSTQRSQGDLQEQVRVAHPRVARATLIKSCNDFRRSFHARKP